MTQAAARTPARSARHDLSARQAIVCACLAMTAIVLLDLVDGRLDLLYSVGFVLIVVTAPLAVGVRTLFPTGVLPAALLVGSLLLVCLFEPSAIQVSGMQKDAGTIARLIAATIDHGMTLVIGQVLALAVIALRILSDPGSGASRSPRR
jgi:predicted neutral ceramidase superfamily lipid hydrolase